MVNKFSAIIESKMNYIIAIVLVLIISFVSLSKYRGGEINYTDSDATWHALLTIRAYDETPVSQHKFLPIVSLGGVENKSISWGETIPDEEGNYYYTSYSPAGYVIPYLFFKLFRLPVNESGLYCFNTLLYIVSALLWYSFLMTVYDGNKSKVFISVIGTIVYIFSPELFHGMGIVYWHQSIMQVLLIIQFYSYYLYKTKDSKGAKIAFYIITFFGPYVEWTGYVANAGFALYELLSEYKSDIKCALKNAVVVGGITVTSFGLFSLHYLCVVDSKDYFKALKSRFFARNFTANTLLSDVFAGYINSFLMLWVLLLFLIVWNIYKNGNIELKNKLLLFILSFPLIENVVMKQHALIYSYDRMKMVFILSFVICELTNQILNSYEGKKTLINSILLMATAVCCLCNLNYYKKDTSYVWDINYRENNEELADYINEKYSDSVLSMRVAVRGYMNLLFEKGIYEGTDFDTAISIALEKDKKYAIELVAVDGSWNLYQLAGAMVYDVINGKYYYIRIDDGAIIEGEYER